MDSISSSTPSTDRDLQIFLLAAAGVIVFMISFFFYCKPYDLATGMFFSFALGLMARVRLLSYLGVFAIANINRETAFLLISIFAIYFFLGMPWRRYLSWILLQVLLFVLIRLAIMAIFADLPGSIAWVDPLRNLQLFLKAPLLSLTHWAGFVIVCWLCARAWSGTPRLLRVSLLVMGPVLMVLYLVVGMAFEIRVFAEIFPVIWTMLVDRKL